MQRMAQMKDSVISFRFAKEIQEKPQGNRSAVNKRAKTGSMDEDSMMDLSNFSDTNEHIEKVHMDSPEMSARDGPRRVNMAKN